MRSPLKPTLTRVGARCPPRAIHYLDATTNYLTVGRWMRARGFVPNPRLHSREEIFDAIGRAIGDQRVLYLEFGVYEGASMRYWSGLLRNPHSALHGFDSFEGLPEPWSLVEGKGHFSTGGAVPAIDDPRVRLIKGLFHETLPGYEPPAHDRLVINIDADLHSAASFVLTRLAPLIGPGTYLYFDEFHDRLHERRAFDEFLTRNEMGFDLVAVSSELSHVAFKRTA